MAIPFPIGLIAPVVKNKLTRIEFDANNDGVIESGGGFENEIDADGGTNLHNFTFANPLSNNSIDEDLTSLNISWDNRYNYRLGFANIYSVSNIKLYKDGILAETQAGSYFSLNAHRPRHIGVNIDSADRNITEIETDSPVSYPKTIAGNKLTSIAFDVGVSNFVGAGGLENELDADGGTNIQSIIFANTNPGNTSSSINLGGDNISWLDRYNYRLGFANIYSVSNIKLYKDGILAETQAGSLLSVTATARHIGMNIDPVNRNQTTTTFGSPIAYPK